MRHLTIQLGFRAEGIEMDDDLYAEDELLRYRVLGNVIQAAVKSSFDRWANSVDFIIDKKSDLIGIRACIRVLRARVGTHDPGEGLEVDVGEDYRRARKALKTEIRRGA